MSRTPERIRDKGAVKRRNILIGVALICGFLALGAFQSADAEDKETGLVLVVVAVGAAYWAFKIKTWLYKDAEIGRYRKR